MATVSQALVFTFLLTLALLAIVVLIVRCIRLEAQIGQRSDALERVQTQLTDSTHAFQDLQAHFNNQLQQAFTTWRDRELESVREQLKRAVFEEARNAFQAWQMETEANIRADAIKRSSAVVSGKVTEHLTPYIGTFPYNPQDVRFLGAPIDLIVFDGLSEGDLRGIIFLEVKTNTSNLSTRERRIRDAIQARRVAWQEFRVGG